MADQSPWYEETKLIRTGAPATPSAYMDRVSILCASENGKFVIPSTTQDFSKLEKPGIMVANAYPHGREGQNVTYADGHNAWETRTDVSVKNDNIYTRWTVSPAPATDTLGIYNRRGPYITTPAPSSQDITPQNRDDSVLVNDGPPAP
jgi:hypothetical protein